MKTYVEQSFKLGGSLCDLENTPIATRKRHWANFGVGPKGGGDKTLGRHQHGAWRLRHGYDPEEAPVEIVVGRHTRPRRNGPAADYVCLHASLGDHERSDPDFVSYDHISLRRPWLTQREISEEKVRDTHKLACLGLPENKIFL